MRRRSEAGFTLIEMIIVVAIIGLIVVVATPNFLSMVRSMKVKTSLRNVTSDIRWARQQAVTLRRPMMISLAAGEVENASYRIYQGTRNGADFTWALRNTKVLADNVYFLSVTNADDEFEPAGAGTDGLKDIVFLENGSIRPRQGNPANAPPSIVLKGDFTNVPKSQFTIDFFLSGQIRATANN